MLIKIIIAAAVCILVLLVVIAKRPADFRITRSRMIGAPPAALFPYVNDLHKWTAWSPWENIDSNLKRTYKGPQEGIGAVYSWVGNSKAGEGSMTITESRPAEHIGIKLEFLKPFVCVHLVEFTFKQQQNNQTAVTWIMTGKNNFISKAMQMFINIDKCLGERFEQGLASLKALGENEGKS